jgi:osmotically inducible protein OsmC
VSLYTAIATSHGRDTRAVTDDGVLDVKLALQKQFGGTGDGTNPEQLFAAGYAACFASSIQLVARRKKLGDITPTATAEVHVIPNGSGGFTLAATMRVTLPDHLDTAVKHELVEAAHQVCPYSNATRGNIPVELVVN